MAVRPNPAEAEHLTTSKDLLAFRLNEAGLNTCRFVRPKPGSKKVVDHILREPHDVEEHYGVKGNGNLVIFDVDDSTALPGDVPLPTTFTTASPHDAEHRYYAVDFEVENEKTGWGSIRSDGWYAIGPGSELNQCDKDYHECSLPGEGKYVIQHDTQITTLDRETLALYNDKVNGEQLVQDADVPTINPTPRVDLPKRITLTTAEWQRLGLAFQRDRDLKLLWDGNYRAAGFDKSGGGVDRSQAEYHLAARLRFWLMYGLPGDVSDRVHAAVEASMGMVGKTNGGEPRKWIDGSHSNLNLYRAETLANAIYDPKTGLIRSRGYTPPDPPGANSGRPTVSWPTICYTERAVNDLGPARMTEIMGHPAIDRSRSQVYAALNHLKGSGTIESWRDPADRRANLYDITATPEPLTPVEAHQQ